MDIVSKYRTEIYGISILWIMMFHSFDLCACEWPGPLRFIHFGNMGCEIFLFLSGICLYFSFQKDQRIIPYMKKRVIRLFIPIVLICSVYWIGLWVSGEIGTTEIISCYLTLNFWLKGDQQIWFLSFLAVAYFIYPYIYHAIYDEEGALIHTAWILAGTVLITVIIQNLCPEFYASTEIALTRFPVFVLGAYCGKFVYEKKKIPPLWIAVSVILVIICFAVLYQDLVHGMLRRYFYMLGGIPLTILLPYIFNLLSWKWLRVFLRFFGEMSLELYLSHIIMIRLYKQGLFFAYKEGKLAGYLIIIAFSILISFAASAVNKKISPWIRQAAGV